MSGFTPEDVQRLAALARLELGPEETEAFARELREILEFARQVDAVDTSRVDASGSLLAPPQEPTREDVLQASLPRREVLAAAPDADLATGLFKVPRVLNG